MSNFVIEIKPAPEFVDLFRAIISAMQAKAPVVQTSTKTPTIVPVQTPPTPIPQQPVVPLAAPAPQYQASANPTPAQPSAPAIPVTPAAPSQPAPMPYPSNPAPQPAAQVATAAPTAAAQTFTLEDVARAAGTLADAGKRQEVCSLIASFGIQTLGQLPKEQYGAFATALRQMGARI